MTSALKTMPDTIDLASVESIPLREWDGFVPPDWDARLVNCDELGEPYVVLFKEAAPSFFTRFQPAKARQGV